MCLLHYRRIIAGFCAWQVSFECSFVPDSIALFLFERASGDLGKRPMGQLDREVEGKRLDILEGNRL
jgi:hypothetical protein